MKTMTLALITSLGLMAAPAMAETNWTWTGPKGGSSVGTTSCSYAEGVTSCNSKSTYTNPKGKVFTRESTGSGDRFGGQREITTTGPDGKSATSTRSWKRN
jgi:hypothetical protein